MFEPVPRLLPVAEGVTEEQVESWFLVTVQVLVDVETPFEAEAIKVLVVGPAVSCDEVIFINELEPERAFPFKVQVRVQEGSLTVATKEF